MILLLLLMASSLVAAGSGRPHFSDPPVPSVIPEGIKKLCKADPTFDVCKKFGLGPKKFSWSKVDSDDELIPRKVGKTDKKKIDCEEMPEHPGCLRNEYLDKFIAWKIRMDCEVDPNGKFCGKCQDSSEESPEDSPEDSPEETPDSPEEKLRKVLLAILDFIHRNGDIPISDPVFAFFQRLLQDAIDNVFHSNGTSSAPPTPPPSSEGLLDLIKLILNDILPLDGISSGPSRPSGVTPEDINRFLSLLRELIHSIFPQAPVTTPPTPQTLATPAPVTPDHGDDSDENPTDVYLGDDDYLAVYSGQIPLLKSFLNTLRRFR
uniref:Clip domain-containing protein n=2 Tax=Caenorhabditis tropicalis TaxID=1561998 RepID=A0A1I7U7N3_9PELO